ncbi:cytochrome P450, family 90, subfamily D, polypeptide 1 [Actinidia rufa]|uniref:Cytochrome P450, family 90, subfamily D, polypeptide 1 n=1 Tax=Actinidia rufa TaxID=165716 RepID=A0A7J0FGW8_9ERIC|nr:cytochrome P450, family 90, subfamily D, polypeptide 1 [Actinidia rufa]
MLLSALFILYRIATTRSRSSSSSTATNSLPSGSLGWPLLGETLEFISCAYSDSPESFMDKRRHWYGKVFKSHLFGSPTIVSTDAEAKKKMVELVNKIIQAKRRSGISEVAKDVVDVLLKDESEKLTDELISDNMIDLMIPGEDSVPVLMTLAIKYLSDCPLALQQLTEENLKLKKLKDQLGEPLCWRDYFSLPFTQHVITETLRMGNIIVGVMRKAMKDVQVKGYLIPKGWCVLTYFRSIHLDEDFYDWPHQFNPWRWQDKEMSNCSFTPFGGGQRLCPGLDLARLETSIFLHHFVTQFRWVAEADSIVNFPTVRMKKRMPVWVKRRREAAFSQEQIKTFQGTSMQL